MYGRRVHEAVIAAGERTSGITIHLVDEEYDCGKVLVRWEVPVDLDDTPATLASASRLWSHNFSSRRYGVSPTER
jgi:phosphoribosylglycinamide formyltransferase 1